MLNILKNTKIRYRLFLLVGLSIVGFIGFGIFSYSTLNTLKVNGPLYKRIVQGKDLIADVLPPPEYIIETYLISLQLLEEADPKKVDILIEKAKSLKGEYDARHEYWVSENFGDTATDKELKDAITVMSFGPAIEFQKVFFDEFLLLIQKGERDKARELAKSTLKEKYEEHRLGVDKVVSMSIDRNKADETLARGIIRSRTIALFFFGLVIIVAILVLCVFIINQITIPLFKVVAIAEKVAAGDFTAEKVEVTSNDEIGRLGEVFNKLIESLNDSFSQVRSFAEKVANSAQQLASSTEEMNASTQEVSSAIQSVAKGSATQAERAAETSEAMDKASITLKQVVINAKATSKAVNETSAKAEKGKSTAQTTAEKITRLTNTVTETAKVIQGLGEKSQAIGEITETITSIADQ
ncbi:MAG: methyl-accepting chemotaxis protein, partial [Candidatus Omnitrophota bacterium]|nr:methyl-accepting chemotaxis protein [Candidatus Omnitrophota bacterium]